MSSREVLNLGREFGMELTNVQNSVSLADAERIRKEFAKAVEEEAPEASPEESRETVKVLKSETGQEVVERRTGAGAVRRRKKVRREEAPEGVETAPQAPDEPETAQPDGDVPLPEEVDAAPAAAEAVEPEAEFVPAEEPEAVSGSRAGEDDARPPHEPPVAQPTAPRTEGPEDEKKQKKKAKKGRPSKEEIHDEETLEELKKAFRTKVPSGPSRKEYVIQNRKPKLRQNFDGAGRRKAASGGSEAGSVAVLPGQGSKRAIRIGETVAVSELAKMMSVKASELLKKLMSMGTAAAINQSIDSDTAELVADEFGFEVNVEKFVEEDLLLAPDDGEKPAKTPRPPVVTVMGHVDHGKTTLLDSIRETDVVAGEAGGITQHIGAYGVTVKDRTIVFVDTPGHEAFTSMRARGASITDIVILVVAADDGVMPQTVEAVNHARAAEVPIIVAVNKVDKEGAEPEKIRRELSEIGLVSEQWGGDTLFAEVSAKKKEGISELLELVLLQADILELGAVSEGRANGVVIEAELDKGRGAVCTVIAGEGTLKVGDCVVSGVHSGKIRAITDDKGKKVKSSGPSLPVKIMGLSGVAEAGEKFYVVRDEKTAREIVSHRLGKARATQAVSAAPKLSLEDLFSSLGAEEAKELPLIIKADTQGSVEALRESVEKLSTEKCRVKIVHTGAGGINETDVVLASASNAVIIGFNVRPDSNALRISEKQGVSLELHSVIYDVVNRIKNAMEGLLEPVRREVVVAHVDVKELFHISRIGTIAGCMVSDGKVSRDDEIRVVRDGTVIFEGRVSSLRRFKEDVKEVQSGYECGITIENFNDIKQGDIFELYKFEEIRQEL